MVLTYRPEDCAGSVSRAVVDDDDFLVDVYRVDLLPAAA